jgi:hypothetical protein
MATLLTELLDGLPAPPCFVLNPGDPGLLRTLERLTAAAASAPASDGGPSIAAHVDHLRYGFHLLNRWANGENPWADSDYAASWRKTVVTDEQWTSLLAELGREAGRWREAIDRAPVNDEIIIPMASIAHLAYHVGAIRQIDRGLGGPRARD